jgi:thymidylate synthase (FAD)
MSELKLIWRPEVFLVGVQAVKEGELKRFLASRGAEGWTTDAPSAAETISEVAGRVCYDSFKNPRPGGNAAYIGHILESRHGNVAEHAAFNFILTGVSRSLTHELIRHRAGVSVSQLSQRYVDSSGVAFVVPPALVGTVRAAQADPYGDDSAVGQTWIEQVSEAVQEYTFLADMLLKWGDGAGDKTARRKAAREAARSVLPNCTETTIFVTANARALRHIFEQRGSIFADAEIRRLSVAWAKVMRVECPNLFGDVNVVHGADGGDAVMVHYSKV